MKKQQPATVTDARKEARRRRRRRLMIIRTTIVLSILLLLLLMAGLLTMKIIGTQQSKRGETTNVLAVRDIVVEGKTRYKTQDIIKESGLYVGQSLMGVNKVRAHDALIQKMPYLDTVEIGNKSFDVLRIRVKEVRVLGAVKLKNGYMMVGVNNRALEKITDEKKLPKGTLQILGGTTVGKAVGEDLLDERSLSICQTLLKATDTFKIENMTAIDITEKTNISIVINGRLRVILGNATGLETQMETLADTLPLLLKNNGKNAAGELDMTSYADNDVANDKAIYTPEDLLKERAKETAKKTKKTTVTGSDTSTTGTTTTTTAAE